MTSCFSEDLILRLKKYFKDRYGQELTTEQAVVFLSSFADLYVLVSDRAGQKRAPAERALAARSYTWYIAHLSGI